MKKQIIFLLLWLWPFAAYVSTITKEGGSFEIDEARLSALQQFEHIVLRHLGINREVEEAMASRARRSAWLPTVTFYGDVDQNHGTAEKKGPNNAETFLEKGEREYGAGVRLTFNFSSLIYSGDEAELKSLDLKKFDKREEIISSVHKAYFRFLRIKNSLASSGKNSNTEILKLELIEVMALLNSMSGGAFGNMASLH